MADSRFIGGVIGSSCFNLGLQMIYYCSVRRIRIHGTTSSYLADYSGLPGRAPSTSVFGTTLLASRLSVADCHPIIQKIEARIRGWDGILLSFAGRVQLIKSVLSALQVYWAMAFILPKHVIKDIEKRLRNFLWKGSIETGYAKVAWQQVCRPVDEGGLGIRDIHALNKGLMSRHLWRLIVNERSSIWVNWISHYRLRNCSVWTISTRSGTWGWRN
ncbi:UNVERIFIED_CONTAM: hypothetical protein Sradi_7299200 [Sesamum radiatum]|uniref:Uncharacterized protein n=1 Tax=Sesamum radiatum TaxID=300843 RepID=A0AAW2I8F1_SESRA